MPKQYAETQNPLAEALREWMDGQQWMAYSQDQVPILVHLPNGFLPKAEVSATSYSFPVLNSLPLGQTL